MINTTCQIVKENKFWLIYIDLDLRKVFQKPKGTIYLSCIINNIEFRSKVLSKGNGVFFIQTNKELQNKLGVADISGKNIPILIELDTVSSTSKFINESNLIENEFINTLITRRSIRRYTDKIITDKQLATIINAGYSAPSAKNKKPYHFIVINNRETLKEIAEKGTNTKIIMQANKCIIVCGDKNLQGITEFLIEDCAAVTQNMLLAIHSLNLGAVWCGVIFNSDWYKFLIQKFNMPDKIVPVTVISIGYPDEVIVLNKIFDQNKVHYNTW